MSASLRWAAVIVGLTSSTAMAAARPTLSFLGVYDATGDDQRSHQVEDLFDAALLDVTDWNVKTPAELDAGELGRDTRLQLLASEAPGLRLKPLHQALGDYALYVAIHPDSTTVSGPDIMTAHLLRVVDGVDCLTKRLPQIDEASVKSMLSSVKDQIDPAEGGTGRPDVRFSHHVRLTHAPLRRSASDAPTVISALVQGTGELNVTVVYRREDSPRWHVVDLIRSRGDRYLGALPPMTPGYVLYYVHVTDDDLNELVASGSEAHPHRLLLVRPVVQPRKLARTPLLVPPPPHDTPSPAPLLRTTSTAESFRVAKWATWGTAIAMALGGVGLGFSTHVFYFTPITEVEATYSQSYRLPVGILLGGAGALGLLGVGFLGLQIAYTPSGTSIVASGKF